MDNNKEKEIADLGRERNELNALIGKGVSFDVKDTEVIITKSWFGLRKKRTLQPVTRHFNIAEPTLSTLDRLSAEWVELAIDERSIKSEDGMIVARSLATQSIRLARIVAIAVLGVDRLVAVPGKNGIVRYVEDTKRLDELTDLFARSIKPSQLHQLYTLINAMCNLGDFVNSIRLMCADRTTMPIRIEENKGV